MTTSNLRPSYPANEIVSRVAPELPPLQPDPVPILLAWSPLELGQAGARALGDFLVDSHRIFPELADLGDAIRVALITDQGGLRPRYDSLARVLQESAVVQSEGTIPMLLVGLAALEAFQTYADTRYPNPT